MSKSQSPKLTFSYSTKYLNTDIVDRCFTPGSHNLVDKIICGNGFTTSFLQIPPSKKYQALTKRVEEYQSDIKYFKDTLTEALSSMKESLKSIQQQNYINAKEKGFDKK